jgi:hypothetical protein
MIEPTRLPAIVLVLMIFTAIGLGMKIMAERNPDWKAIRRAFWAVRWAALADRSLVLKKTGKGRLTGGVYWFLRCPTLAVDMVHRALTDDDPYLVECWSVLCLLFGVFLLLLPWPWVVYVGVGYCILRVMDLLAVFLRHAILSWIPVSFARAAILLGMHYAEIVVAFAFLYLCVQERWWPPAFYPGLTRVGALHFSLLTASTIGFGDLGLVRGHHDSFLAVTLIMYAEVGCVLSILVIEFPRMLAATRRST